MPTDVELEQARRALDKTQSSLDRARAQAAGADGRTAVVRLPESAPPTSIDIDAVARRYREKSVTELRLNTEQIYVFASASLAPETLKRIGMQARRAGAVVVFRGLLHGFGQGNWAKSMQALQPVYETGAEVHIHPDLFRQFGVTAVPTVVVAASAPDCRSEEKCLGAWAKVVGDVSLEYALEQLTDRRDQVGTMARAAVARIRTP